MYKSVQVETNTNTCTVEQVIWTQYLCRESYLIVRLNVTICAGARVDIQNGDGNTPIQLAEEALGEKSDPKEKQQYEKVHEDGHTNTHTQPDTETCMDNTLIKPLNANGNVVQFCTALLAVFSFTSNKSKFMLLHTLHESSG